MRIVTLNFSYMPQGINITINDPIFPTLTKIAVGVSKKLAYTIIVGYMQLIL